MKPTTSMWAKLSGLFLLLFAVSLRAETPDPCGERYAELVGGAGGPRPVQAVAVTPQKILKDSTDFQGLSLIPDLGDGKTSLIVDLDSAAIQRSLKDIIQAGDKSLPLKELASRLNRFSTGRARSASSQNPRLASDRWLGADGRTILETPDLERSAENADLFDALVAKKAVDQMVKKPAKIVHLATSGDNAQPRYGLLVQSNKDQYELIAPHYSAQPIPVTDNHFSIATAEGAPSLTGDIRPLDLKTTNLTLTGKENEGKFQLYLGEDRDPLVVQVAGRSKIEKSFKTEEELFEKAGPEDMVPFEWMYNPFYVPLGHTSIRVGNVAVEFSATKGVVVHGDGKASARSFLLNNPFFKTMYNQHRDKGIPPFSVGMKFMAKKKDLEEFINQALRYRQDGGKAFHLYSNNCNSCMLSLLAKAGALDVDVSKRDAFSSAYTFQKFMLDPNIPKTEVSIYPLPGVDTDGINMREAIPKVLYRQLNPAVASDPKQRPDALRIFRSPRDGNAPLLRVDNSQSGPPPGVRQQQRPQSRPAEQPAEPAPESAASAEAQVAAAVTPAEALMKPGELLPVRIKEAEKIIAERTAHSEPLPRDVTLQVDATRNDVLKAMYKNGMVDASPLSMWLSDKLFAAKLFEKYLGKDFEKFHPKTLGVHEFLSGKGLLDASGKIKASREEVLAALQKEFPNGLLAKPASGWNSYGVSFKTRVEQIVDDLFSPQGSLYTQQDRAAPFYSNELGGYASGEKFILQEKAGDSVIFSNNVNWRETTPTEFRIHTLNGKIVKDASQERWNGPKPEEVKKALTEAEAFTQKFLNKLPQGLRDRQAWSFDIMRVGPGPDDFRVIETNTNRGKEGHWSARLHFGTVLGGYVRQLENDYGWKFTGMSGRYLRNNRGNEQRVREFLDEDAADHRVRQRRMQERNANP